MSWVSKFHFFLSFELGFRKFFFKENRLKFHVKKKREMLKNRIHSLHALNVCTYRPAFLSSGSRNSVFLEGGTSCGVTRELT